MPAGYVPGPHQVVLLEAMTALIAELQDFLGVAVKAGCGLRSDADVKRLIAQGYNPSRTSDHFYGIPMPQKDGTFYTDSCGAADLYVAGLPGLFGHIVDHFARIADPAARPHQMIYETGKFSDWLHIANAPLVAFPDAAAAKKHLSPRPLLYSFDCGKTYQVFDPLDPPAKLKKNPAFAPRGL